MVKNPPVSAGDARNVYFIPGSGRSLENGNPMDRGVWRDTVHGVTKNRTQLND